MENFQSAASVHSFKIGVSEGLHIASKDSEIK